MRALSDDAPLIENYDPIRILNGPETMGDDDSGTALHHPLKPFLNLCFGERIDAGSRLIQD